MPLAYEIVEQRLDNGLRVVVNEDHSVPTVTVNLWVGVGSRHEREGRSGFAHLFEHLMFQGSRNVAAGEHFSALMAHGARLNATTWFDRTNYFETVPTGAYEVALWMEADRHGYLLDALTQENLDNQRDVVKEEKRQRYDNVPYGTALHRLYAEVFPAGHPYHHPTIGSMEDLDAASLQDVHDFFRAHYRPGNTVLTLAGDLTPEQGFAAAERYFGQIPDAPVAPPPPAPPLPPLPQPVRVDVREDVPTDRLYLGFRLPVDDSHEYFAAASALDALAGLTIARLERRLVRGEQSCHHVSAASMGLVGGASTGFIAADVAQGHDIDAVEEAVCAELVRLGEEGPTPAEMEAVGAQNERAWLTALAGQDERADHLSHRASLFGDPAGINTLLERVDRVTPQDVRRAAATWLTPQARATIAYRATPTAQEPR